MNGNKNTRGDGTGRPSGISKLKSKSNLIQPRNYRLPRSDCNDERSTTTASACTEQTKISEQSPTDEEGQVSPFLVTGTRVCLAGVKLGTLRYFGKTLFADGYWCGIELDDPEGKNNGTVDGVSYFSCATNHGIFAPPAKVEAVQELPEPVQGASCALLEAFSVQNKGALEINSKMNNRGVPRVRRLASPKVTVKRKAEHGDEKLSVLNSAMDCTYDLNNVTYESQPKVLRKGTGIPLPVSVSAGKESFIQETHLCNKTFVPSSSSHKDKSSTLFSEQPLSCYSDSHLSSNAGITLSPRDVQRTISLTLNTTFVTDGVSLDCSFHQPKNNESMEESFVDDVFNEDAAEVVLSQAFDVQSKSFKSDSKLNSTFVHNRCEVSQEAGLHQLASAQSENCDGVIRAPDVQLGVSASQVPLPSLNATFSHDQQYKAMPNSQSVKFNLANEYEALRRSQNVLRENTDNHPKVTPFSPNTTFTKEKLAEKLTSKSNTEIYSLPNSPEYKLSLADLELLTSTCDMRRLVEETTFAGDYPFTEMVPAENCESDDLVFGYGRQGSFDLDDSLGILTPNQMKDFTIFTENSIVKTPSVEDVQELCEETVEENNLPHYLVFEEPNQSPTRCTKETALKIADCTTSTPKPVIHEIVKEPVPPIAGNLSFFPLSEFINTPQSVKSTVSEDRVRDLSCIDLPDDHIAQAGLLEQSLDAMNTSKGYAVQSDDELKDTRRRIIDSVNMPGDTKSEKRHNLNCNVNFSDFLDEKDVHFLAAQLKGSPRSAAGSREHNFHHIITNKSASDVADKLLVGVMNESVKEVVATCMDPFEFTLGKTESTSNELPTGKDHAMTEYLMQQMGQNFCDQISEKKDRPMSALTVSVTSIDTGYQGDAECDVHSATTSAINTPVEEPKKSFGDDKDSCSYPAEGLCVLRHPKTDVGSDSDFCSDMGTSWTESELENEEKVRGRCARVIDGTLYFNDNEVQEKSVCVKDENLSNGMSVQDSLNRLSVVENVPDHSEKSTEENMNDSSVSEESGTLIGNDLEVGDGKLLNKDEVIDDSVANIEQVTESHESMEPLDTQSLATVESTESTEVLQSLKESESAADTAVAAEVGKTVMEKRNSATASQVFNKSGSVRKKQKDDATPKSKPLKKDISEKCKVTSGKPEARDSSSGGAGNGEADSDKVKISPGKPSSSEKLKYSPRKIDVEAPKKVKTPKKNVMSKIKAMIEATSCKVTNDDETSEDSKKPARTPKKSRWEAVMSKIAAGQAEEKAKGKTIREVRSKIATTWTATKSPPLKSDDAAEKVPNRYSNGSAHSNKSTPRTSRTLSEPANPEELVDDIVSINSSNRSSHSDLSASQQSVGKISSKSRLPRMPPAATSHKSERPCSPSQMSDISTMSAASHLSATSHASHVSARGLPRSATSLTSRRTLPKSRDDSANLSKAVPVSSKVRLNNTRNLSLGSSNKSLSAVTGSKRSSPLANGTANMKQRAASAANLNTSQNKSTVPPRPLKPPVPSRVVAPAKTLPTRAQPLKEQNRIRNLKTAPSALRTGNQQPDLLNTSVTSNKVEVCKEILRLEALCETRTKENSCLKTRLDHCAVGFEALTMVVKYMADELDAFSNPYLVRDVRILQARLEKVKSDFDEAIQSKENLEGKISDLLKTHELDIEDLKAKHGQELDAIRLSLTETHQKELDEERKTFADTQVAQKEMHQLEIEKILAHHKSRHLEVRLRHEEEISKLVDLHMKQVEGIKKQHELLVESLKTQSASIEEDLRKHLSLLTSQCHELQQQNREFEDVILKDSDLKMQVAAGKICELNKEVDSLKTVVELRNKEIHDLRSSNNKLRKLEEELHLSQERVSLLTSRMEDLQAQVDIKNKHGRKLTTEHQVLKEWYERESKASKRLSLEKEELQWKLQQTIESSPLHAGNTPDFALMKSYSELDTIFTPVRTCSGDCSPEQSTKSNRIQTLLSSPIYSKLPAAKLGSPVMSRSSTVRQRQRQRFSISETDATTDSSSLAGVRYRRAASMSWTVGLDHGDAPDCLLSRLSLNCDPILPQESEQSGGAVDYGSGDHTPERHISDNSEVVEKQVMEKDLCPSLDERLQLAVQERLKSTEGKYLCEKVNKLPCSEENERICIDITQSNLKFNAEPNEDALFCSKHHSDSKENLKSLESPLSEASELSEVSDGIISSGENNSRKMKLERRLSNADARVPSLITVQQLDEQVGAASKSRPTSAKRDRKDATNLKRISVTKCSSPKSTIRQERNSNHDTGAELIGNVRVVGKPTSITELSKAMREAQSGQEISTVETNTNYESFEADINKGNCTIIDATETSGSAHWDTESPIHDLKQITIDAPSGVSVTKNSSAPYISVDKSPCAFEEVNRENADCSQPDLLCSSVDTIELDCSSHSSISIPPQLSMISYTPADSSGLDRKDVELLFDGLQNIFSCDWGNDVEDKVSRKSESSVVNSESGSSPSKSSLVITFKPQKLAGSSCDSSPPPEPLEMLQVSESSTSHSEESSPLPSPTFRSRPEEVTENLSCSYTMSPRTSAGEAMVLVDLSSTLRQEPSRDTSGLLLRRTFHDQYLTDSISSCNSSLRVSAEAYSKDSSSEEMSQQCNSKPATPESCSQAVAPTDSTNIDLSWSDDDEDDIPSESEV